MKGWGVLAAFLLFLLLMLPVKGAELSEAVGVDKLNRAAEAYLAGYLNPAAVTADGFHTGAKAIVEGELSQNGALMRKAVSSGVILLAIALLCGLTERMGETLGDPIDGLNPSRLAGAAAVTAIAATDVHGLIGLGRLALGQMETFSQVLLPTVTAACAAAGMPAAAAARQSAVLMFFSLLLTVINTLAVPLIYAYVAAAAACAAVGNEGLGKIAALLRHGVTVLLSGLVTVFVLFLSVSGAASGGIDALTQKAARTAISGMVPVVGGILSDAADTVVAGAGVLRGTVGVLGLLCVLAICLGPFLRLGCHYLVYKLAAALAATVSPGPVAGLIDELGSAFALVLGMTGAGAAILYVALLTSIQTVTP